MNVNFGLFPPLAPTLAKHADKNVAKHTNASRSRGSAKTDVKKRALCARALQDLENWQFGRVPAAAE